MCFLGFLNFFVFWIDLRVWRKQDFAPDDLKRWLCMDGDRWLPGTEGLTRARMRMYVTTHAWSVTSIGSHALDRDMDAGLYEGDDPVANG